ncbi:MAG TPA: hypothetical protein VG538_06215 [Vicinamibacterales bacterium]|nr:hypothetical protein [Vicinamibacterales bacterium]
MDWLHSTRAHQAMAGALAGFVTAIEADIDAFRAWKAWHDLVVYDWRTATFRWCKGIVLGALTGVGLGATFGI